MITLSVQEGRRRNPEPPLYDEDVPIGIIGEVHPEVLNTGFDMEK